MLHHSCITATSGMANIVWVVSRSAIAGSGSTTVAGCAALVVSTAEVACSVHVALCSSSADVSCCSLPCSEILQT